MTAEISTPQIEATLRDLSEMCLGSIQDSEPFDDQRARLLVENLKMNGWDRYAQDQKPLRDQLRERVFDALPGTTHPRRGELDGLISKIQTMYNAANHFDTKLPVEDQRVEQEPRDQAQPPHTTLQGG